MHALLVWRTSFIQEKQLRGGFKAIRATESVDDIIDNVNGVNWEKGERETRGTGRISEFFFLPHCRSESRIFLASVDRFCFGQGKIKGMSRQKPRPSVAVHGPVWVPTTLLSAPRRQAVPEEPDIIRWGGDRDAGPLTIQCAWAWGVV